MFPLRGREGEFGGTLDRRTNRRHSPPPPPVIFFFHRRRMTLLLRKTVLMRDPPPPPPPATVNCPAKDGRISSKNSPRKKDNDKRYANGCYFFSFLSFCSRFNNSILGGGGETGRKITPDNMYTTPTSFTQNICSWTTRKEIVHLSQDAKREMKSRPQKGVAVPPSPFL